jgi:hypothetical protein
VERVGEKLNGLAVRDAPDAPLDRAYGIGADPGALGQRLLR